MPSVYSAGRLPRTSPEPKNEKSRLGFPGGFPLKISVKSAPLATQTSRERMGLRIALPAIALAIPRLHGGEDHTQHDLHTMKHHARSVNK